MKEESNETILISALERCSPTLAEALYGRAENEPERSSSTRLCWVVLPQANEIKKFFSACSAGMSKSWPRKNVFAGDMKAIVARRSISSLPRTANVDKSRREKGRKFSDWVFSKGNEAREILPFSDQSAYRECGGGGGEGRRKKSRQIEFRWNAACFHVMPNFFAHSAACNNNQRSLWGRRGVKWAELE